jgi:hypothetical protein
MTNTVVSERYQPGLNMAEKFKNSTGGNFSTINNCAYLVDPHQVIKQLGSSANGLRQSDVIVRLE